MIYIYIGCLSFHIHPQKKGFGIWFCSVGALWYMYWLSIFLGTRIKKGFGIWFCHVGALLCGPHFSTGLINRLGQFLFGPLKSQFSINRLGQFLFGPLKSQFSINRLGQFHFGPLIFEFSIKWLSINLYAMSLTLILVFMSQCTLYF